jgi:hypothetical protein
VKACWDGAVVEWSGDTMTADSLRERGPVRRTIASKVSSSTSGHGS